jgi:predicted nucleic acid-binding protein
MALAVCGQLDLLEKMYGSVLIPEAVFDEISVMANLTPIYSRIGHGIK